SGHAYAMQRHGHDRIRGRAHPAGAARIEFFKLTSHTAPAETLSDIGDLNYQFGWTADRPARWRKSPPLSSPTRWWRSTRSHARLGAGCHEAHRPDAHLLDPHPRLGRISLTEAQLHPAPRHKDRKSTRLNSSHD